jgi:hypothetical protein
VPPPVLPWAGEAGGDTSWDLTAPWATLIAASVALIGVGITVWQKWRADRRDAWWKRAEWAIDKSLSDDAAHREIGSETMGILVNEPFGGSDTDVRVLKIALLRAWVDFR